MNVVFLSPHFPPHYFRFCLQLKQFGARVLGIGDAPFEQLSAEVKTALTDYYSVTDLHNYEALLRACGHYTHQYGKIDRLDSLNEYWLDTEARLRDDFNISGIRADQIAQLRRKSLMKERFRAAGAPVARGRLVHTPPEAHQLIKKIGFPVVVKPDAGVGALNTWCIDDPSGLDAFFARKPAQDFFMEEFIDGVIYSFDGLADRAAEPVFYTGHVFSQGIMETVNERRHIFYHSLRELPEALEAIGRRCLREFEVRERFFHIEFFRTADDTFVALETNLRPPGGFTTDMFNFACDIDIYRIWAELIVHGRTELNYSRKYYCCYASRVANRNYRHSHTDILFRYGDRILQVEHVPDVFKSALGDTGYIFRSTDLDTLSEIVAYIHDTRPDEE
jgi:hypothetical protein